MSLYLLHFNSQDDNRFRWQYVEEDTNCWYLYVAARLVGSFTDEGKRLIDMMMLGKGSRLRYNFTVDGWAEIRPVSRV